MQGQVASDGELGRSASEHVCGAASRADRRPLQQSRQAKSRLRKNGKQETKAECLARRV